MYRFFSFLVIILFGFVSLGSAEELTVMAWNLMDMDLFDGFGIGRIPWQLDAELAIANTIRTVGPDVLFISEAPSLIELEEFIGRNDLEYNVVHVRQQSGRRDFADSMALLTREPVASAILITPSVPGSSRKPETSYLDWSYRGLLIAELGELTIVGLHLKSPWDGKRRSYEIRNAQALALIRHLDSFQGPLIVLGDFNDSPGLDDAETSFGIPDTIGLIENRLMRSPGEEITQKKGFNLDHIFLQGGQIGDRRVEATDWTLSDHRPVWTTVRF